MFPLFFDDIRTLDFGNSTEVLYFSQKRISIISIFIKIDKIL